MHFAIEDTRSLCAPDTKFRDEKRKPRSLGIIKQRNMTYPGHVIRVNYITKHVANGNKEGIRYLDRSRISRLRVDRKNTLFARPEEVTNAEKNAYKEETLVISELI